MKKSTSTPTVTGQYESAPTIRTPWLPRGHEQIRQRAQAIYRARSGMMRMTLNDWLKAELELKQELEKQITNK